MIGNWNPALTRLGVLALVLAALLSTAAQCTKTTCVNGTCTVTIEGGGGTEVDGLDDINVTVLSTSGDRAQVSVAGAQAELIQGQTARVGNHVVVAKKITGDKVTLRISRA